MKIFIWRLFKGPNIEGPFKPQSKNKEPVLQDLPEKEISGKVFEYGKEWQVTFNADPCEGVHLEYDAQESVHTVKVDSTLRPLDWSTIRENSLKVDKYRNIKSCILQGDTYTQIVDKLSQKEGYKMRTVQEYGRLIRKVIGLQKSRQDEKSRHAARATA